MPILSLYDILAKEPEPIDWLIEGLIPHGDRCIVYGEWGSLKSWLLLHMGLHIAAGVDWLGWHVPQPRTVLYVDEEMHPATLQRRIRRLFDGAELAQWSLPFYCLPRQGLVMDATGPARLMSWCQRAGIQLPQVIILESLRRILPGSENDAGSIIHFWHAIESLSIQGCTVIISHHMHKPTEGRGVRHAASGSTDIMAGADSSLAIHSRHEDTVTIQAVKGREAAEEGAFQVQLLGKPPEPITITRIS